MRMYLMYVILADLKAMAANIAKVQLPPKTSGLQYIYSVFKLFVFVYFSMKDLLQNMGDNFTQDEVGIYALSVKPSHIESLN